VAEPSSADLEVQGVPPIEPEEIRLPTSDPRSLKQVEPLDSRRASRDLTAYLFLPPEVPREALRNRAAMVLVQGLGGVKPQREMTYARKLAAAGYVALVIDSFKTRGLDGSNDSIKALMLNTWQMLSDTFSALRYLARHPAVNPDAICCMGFSWGGMVVVLAAYEQIRRTYLAGVPLHFAGHVSYYGCSVPRLKRPTTTGAPVMILLGEHDANVSLERSKAIADDLRQGGSQVDVEIFDALHQWDGNDYETRHIDFALRDIAMEIDPDNRIRPEGGGIEITGHLTKLAYLARDVSRAGYDIERDRELHRKTDRLLLDFMRRTAEAAGAVPGEAGAVQLGSIDDPRSR
jgi:dienelactone hydrolase